MKKLFLYFFTFSVVFSLVETPVLGQGLLKGARDVSCASENAARRAGNAAGKLPTAARRLPVPAVSPAVPDLPATLLGSLIDKNKHRLFNFSAGWVFRPIKPPLICTDGVHSPPAMSGLF